MQTKPFRIGTRGSPLALAQAHEARDRLMAAHGLPEEMFEIVVLTTKGDRITDRSLAAIGGKGLFTEELEQKLSSGELDFAVHSAKDMATKLPEGLALISLPAPRGYPRFRDRPHSAEADRPAAWRDRRFRVAASPGAHSPPASGYQRHHLSWLGRNPAAQTGRGPGRRDATGACRPEAARQGGCDHRHSRSRRIPTGAGTRARSASRAASATTG